MTPFGLSNAQNHVEAKPRGIAWTTLTLFGVGLWTFIFRPDWPIGCAYPNPDSLNKERLPFVEAWHNLHPIFRRWKGRELEVINNSEQEFRVGWKLTNKVNHQHNLARWDIVASDKAGVYKGSRMNLMIAVEAGLWEGNGLKNYIAENEPSIMLGNNIWGMCLIGGTSNAIINKSSAYREIFESNQAYRASRHFTPVTMVLEGCIDYTTGKSLTDKAYDIIIARRNKYMDDPDRYQQELIENPLQWEEAFIPNIQFAYNAQSINEQVQYVKFNQLDKLWVRGRLYYPDDINGVPTKEVRFLEDSEGKWLINLEGQPNFSYEGLDIAGIDDTFKGLDPNARRKKDASQNAMVVYRKKNDSFPGKTDFPIGVYLGHDSEMNTIYSEFLKGMRFWNIKYTLYEYNNEAFVNFLKDEGELGRLYYVDGKPGIKINPGEKAVQTLLGSKYFRDGRHKNNTSVEVMEALGIWGSKENTDIGSAIHLVFQLDEFTKDQAITRVDRTDQSVSSYIVLGTGNNRNEGSNSYIKLPYRRTA